MKLASLKAGGRDGTLIVVNRTLTHYVEVPNIAATLQQAIDDWSNTAPRLNGVSEALNAGERQDAASKHSTATRAWPWHRGGRLGGGLRLSKKKHGHASVAVQVVLD